MVYITPSINEYLSVGTSLNSLNTNNTYNLTLSTSQQLDVTKLKDLDEYDVDANKN